MTNVETVQIQLIELNKKEEVVVGQFSGNDPKAKLLIDVLKGCNAREIVKFRAKYKVTLNYFDKSVETFLILDSFMQVNGLSYRCEKNLEKALDSLREHR